MSLNAHNTVQLLVTAKLANHIESEPKLETMNPSFSLKVARTYCKLMSGTSQLTKNAIGSCTIDKNSKHFFVCPRMGL